MRSVAILFRDVLFLLLGIMMLVLLILLPWINEAVRRADDLPADEEVVIEIRWPDGNPDDVDLWVRPPDGRPVGYSSKNGPNCDLLRDDLGSPGDPLQLNYEYVRCRSAADGEYVVNLHLYTSRSGAPVDVIWAVRVRNDAGVLRLRASGTARLVS